MSILEVRDVRYAYHTRGSTNEVLSGATCSFEEGQTYSIVGRSGSGKSTLLTLMAGLDIPNSGQIMFAGESTASLDRNLYRRSQVGIIYQDFSLFPLLTVLENIMYPLNLNGIDPKTARAKAEELAAKVGLPSSLHHRYPSKISGGEQQRVAIARALTMDRRLILADEPTGNLDSENSNLILDILTRLAHEDHCCVIIVTHDLTIMTKTDKVYQIVDGTVREQELKVN